MLKIYLLLRHVFCETRFANFSVFVEMLPLLINADLPLRQVPITRVTGNLGTGPYSPVLPLLKI